ncbi:hypothetical protein Poli38472_013620 [Pythium oligandrum]|uniref:Uncharacterized protein n=1 Tax=Pythium oligandrum TaxID=41045 RepID=A0A8K1FIW0_PYTOL|nr:hypothetical protein Poli38472_013620 [Pythium oligandrum]|eukprot:TMW61157.1 hypothetical protein Poli38472_013620 [Pythium oligandrum]
MNMKLAALLAFSAAACVLAADPDSSSTGGTLHDGPWAAIPGSKVGSYDSETGTTTTHAGIPGVPSNTVAGGAAGGSVTNNSTDPDSTTKTTGSSSAADDATGSSAGTAGTVDKTPAPSTASSSVLAASAVVTVVAATAMTW